MGQILHGCARTTTAVRREIQNSAESLNTLAGRYGVNKKTVAKWRDRDSVEDMAMGPKNPRSKALTEAEEAAVVAFRRYSLLPLDDCLYVLQESIPHLSRSTLHRCFERHGISRLVELHGEKPVKKAFKSYPIGYFHVDFAELQTAEGKQYLFVAIDRTSKFAYVELHDKATREAAVEFLERLVKEVPYKIHTVLTDNGAQFVSRPGERKKNDVSFGMVCHKHVIDHRLTKVGHPWTNGQVERMNRTLKDATVKKYYYETHLQLKGHMQKFLMAYNFAKRLKALKGLTPYEYICKLWTSEPERFMINPYLHTVGPNTSLHREPDHCREGRTKRNS